MKMGAAPRPPESELPEVPWRAWEGLVIWVLAFLASAVLSIGPYFVLGRKAFALFVALLFEAVLLVLVVAWVRHRHHVGLEALGWRHRPGSLRAGLVWGAVGFGLSLFAGSLTLWIAGEVSGGPVEAPEQLPSGLTGGELVLAGVVAVAVAPLAEELFFRGFVYQALRRWGGVARAIWISGIAFGVAHLIPLLMPALALLGVAFAFAFERRRSLVTTTVAHGVHNLIALLLIAASQRP